jgi:hypothetical protein
MLFGPWMEAKPAKGKLLVERRPDGTPLAIGALLAVIHSRCELLPNISPPTCRTTLVSRGTSTTAYPWCFARVIGPIGCSVPAAFHGRRPGRYIPSSGAPYPI